MDFEFSTRRYPASLIEKYDWDIGEYTYGNPMLFEHKCGSLKIERFCSIAHNVTLVISNHRMDLPSTYNFRTLFGFWPSAEHSLPDHDIKVDVIIIGNDV